MSPEETPLVKEPIVPRRKATVRFSQSSLNRIMIGVILVMAVVLGFLGYRAILSFRAAHDIAEGTQNLHAIDTALKSYAEDWDKHLPPAENWAETVKGWLNCKGKGGNEGCMHAPGDVGEVGYVYNDLAAGYSLETNKHDQKDPKTKEKAIDPSQLVVLFEKLGAKSNTHMSIPVQINRSAEQELGKELSFSHNADDEENATGLVLYANGYVKRWTKKDFK